MRKNKKLSFSCIALLFVSLFFGSCTSDLYFASTFLNKFERQTVLATEKIYVALPQGVIHTNSSLNDIAGFMFMSEREQDSVIASKTAILNQLDDSTLLAQFTGAFLYSLSRSQIPVVIVDNPSRLPVADEQHFTVNFVQMEAEEYLQPHQSKFTTRGGTNYSYDYQLRHFSLNVWMRLDARDTSDVIYFRNREIDETYRGTVTSLRDGKAKMKTHYERISPSDAYRLAWNLGVECATLYIEKILTEYVCRTKGTNETYFYYNPACNCIESIDTYSNGAKYSFEKM